MHAKLRGISLGERTRAARMVLEGGQNEKGLGTGSKLSRR